jgi:transaldolase
MKIFIDTADLDEIKEAYSSGIVEGITTNPSLIKKAVDSMKKKGKKVSLENYIKEILKIARGTPVSLEVAGTDYENMLKEGKELYRKFNPVAKNVYVKIPVNPSLCDDDSCKRNDFDGIKTIKALSKAKIAVNCTLIFSPEQALIAAKAGAKFVSPFAGREDDFIREKNHIKFNKRDYFSGLKKDVKLVSDQGILSGMDLIKKCVDIIKSTGLKTEVLAASIRTKRQLREAALAGADIATIPYSVLKDTLVHLKSAEGMKKFTQDIVPEYSRLIKKKIKK